MRYEDIEIGMQLIAPDGVVYVVTDIQDRFRWFDAEQSGICFLDGRVVTDEIWRNPDGSAYVSRHLSPANFEVFTGKKMEVVGEI